MTLQDIKETKRHGHTFVLLFVRTDGQRIPSHKHSLRGGGGGGGGGGITIFDYLHFYLYLQNI